MACYYTDDWLSFESAANEIGNLRRTDFGKIPNPPVVLVGIDRKVSTTNRLVTVDDAAALSAQYSVAFAITTIENQKFSNADVYHIITAAQPLSLANEKA